MKAVVLARGLGRRMQQDTEPVALTDAQRAAAAAGHKGMVPIGDAGRPFLDHVLSHLADAGCPDVCLVVAPDHEAVRAYYAKVPPRRVRVHYAVQDEPTGTAHAVLAAEAFVRDEGFLVLNADNLYPVEVLRALAALEGPGLAAFERRALVEDSGFPPERAAHFAVLAVNAEGWLTSIREKPPSDDPALQDPHALISMNVWRFDSGIFQACREVPRSRRGEHELPEAVALALSRGVRFKAVPARGAVLDLSRRGDVPHVTRRLAGREPHP